MIDAYQALHSAGYAHSFESWSQGRLVGGLYGVSIGRAFFGESMFHLYRDASKVALYYLVEYLKTRAFELIDVQQSTAHLQRLGAREISRKDFLIRLADAVSYPGHVGSWAE
jgi:leucyl/phenylalanyl-tRNA--protein transferase